MALQYKVESLEGIDEAAQGLYKETEGGFVLEVEGVVPESKYAELNQKHVDAQTEAQRRRKTVERVTGKLGLENADGLDEALDALLNGKGKGNADNEAIVAQLKQDYEGKLKEAEGKYTGVLMNGAVAETKASLQEAGFPAKVAEMLAKTSTDRLKVDDTGKIRIMADNGNPLAGSGDDGYATYADLAKEFAAAMPDLLVDKGKGGGGKPPASGGQSQPKSSRSGMKAADKAKFIAEHGADAYQSLPE